MILQPAELLMTSTGTRMVQKLPLYLLPEITKNAKLRIANTKDGSIREVLKKLLLPNLNPDVMQSTGVIYLQQMKYYGNPKEIIGASLSI